MQVEAQEAMREALAIVHGQAEDEGLWFEAVTSSEDYLQRELRRLHAAVEKATPPQTSPEPLPERWKGEPAVIDSKFRRVAAGIRGHIGPQDWFRLGWHAALSQQAAKE